MKKFLLLTQHFPPVNIVGALRPFRMVKHLCKNGWHVRVVANSPTTENDRDYQLLEELPGQNQIYFLPHETPFTADEIIRRKGFSTRPNRAGGNFNFLRNPIVRRIFGNSREVASKILFPDIEVINVPVLYRKVRKAIHEFSPDIVLTTSPPHSLHLVGLALKKNYGRKWIADFRDPWDYYPQKGHYEIDNRLERFWNDQVMRNADCIISSSRMYSSILKNKHQDIPRHKFVTITNSFDINKIPLKSDKDPKRFIISYTGIFYPEKDPFTFFRALKTWFSGLDRKNYEHYSNLITVQLIGSSNYRVKNVIRDLDLEKSVKFVGRQPHIEAIKLSKNSDMLLIATGLGPKTRPGWTPSKLYEYLGCRVPILAVTREGELSEIIRKTNSGYIVTGEDHARIRNILKIEIDKKFNIDKKAGKRLTFEGVEEYEEKHVMNKFVALVENLQKFTTDVN